MRNDILEKKHLIELWVREERSKAWMCRQLQCKPETLNSYLDKLGIDYKGNQGGKNHKKSWNRKTALEYSESSHVSSHKLRLKLIEDGIKESKCERCNQSQWLSCDIPLELHHIDGNHYNNDFDNLMIVCPNCHKQLETSACVSQLAEEHVLET